MFPTETNAEKPRPRSFASSSSTSPSAPLCDANEIDPGGNARGAKVALSRGRAAERPRQFGPIIRAPWARTVARSSASRAAPSGPTSAKPAEMTQSARVPRSSARSAPSRTTSAGRQTTARSTVSGRSSTDANPATPATGSPLRLTA